MVTVTNVRVLEVANVMVVPVNIVILALTTIRGKQFLVQMVVMVVVTVISVCRDLADVQAIMPIFVSLQTKGISGIKLLVLTDVMEMVFVTNVPQTLGSVLAI